MDSDTEQDYPSNESDFSFEDESDGYGDEDHETSVGSDVDYQHTITTDAVEYKCSTLREFVYKEFITPANTIQQQLVSVSYDDILVMLHYCKWSQEDVIDNFYDNHNNFMQKCGLVEQGKNNLLVSRDDYSCMICCEDYDTVETYALTCGHEYCVNCYGEYCRNNTANGGLIRCMDTSCNLTIPHQDVQTLAEKFQRKVDAEDDVFNIAKPDDEDGDIYRPMTDGRENMSYSFNGLLKAAAKKYITGKRSNCKWCPAPDCDGLVEVISKKDKNEEADVMDLDIHSIPMVTCPNGHGFCFDCQKEDHLPCPCKMVRQWIQKCNDDSETANWIQANTNACPACHANIEKNGGCNHMTCSTCRFEFCWICLQKWSIHGSEYYRCDKYVATEKESIANNKTSHRNSLQRYLHYYKRFSLHESSMKGDSRTLDIVNQRMEVFMAEQSKLNKEIVSWIDVQFLQDACKALTNGRKTLKWTYCLSFYLDSSNYSEVFEQLQEYLNRVVEDLSKIFEQIIRKKNEDVSTEIIMKEKQNIINLSSLVLLRQKTLIECAASGLKEGLLVVPNK